MAETGAGPRRLSRAGAWATTAGSSARCCSSRRPSTTSTARCSGSSRRPQAEHRLERRGVRLHRHRVPGRLRDRAAARRAVARPARHQDRLRARSRRSGASPRWLTRWRARRSASAPRASRSVSAKPATSRPRSRRWPSGSRSASARFATGIFNAGTNVGAIIAPLVVPVDRAHLRLALGVHPDRRASGFCWLLFWLPTVRPPRSSIRAVDSRRARATSAATRTSPRGGSRGCSLAAAPPDLGVRARQVHDRPDLVVLLVLDPEVPQRQARPRRCSKLGPPLVAIYLIADVGIDRRRLAVLDAAASAAGSVNAARKTAMLVCALCVMPIVFASRVDEHVGRGRPRRPRRGRAPGLVRQPVHARVRHVPAPRRRLGRRASAAWPARSAAC